MKIYYSSIDGFERRLDTENLVEAQAFAQKWVGKHPEIGSSYAISGDGVGKIEADGVSLSQLFPEAG